MNKRVIYSIYLVTALITMGGCSPTIAFVSGAVATSYVLNQANLGS